MPAETATITGPDTAITSTEVGEPSPDNREMETKYWRNIRPLRAGSEAMRAAGTRLLPLRAREEEVQWARRRDQSFLDPYYDDAVDQAASRPFTQPVTIRGEVPEQLAPLEQNMDQEGSNLTVFAKDAFDAGIDYGMTHVFVDFPAIEVETAEEERLLRARPTAVHVEPPNLLGTQFLTMPTGEDVMVRCRIYDTYRRRDMSSADPYAEIEIDRVRVYHAPLPASTEKADLINYARFVDEEIRYDDFVELGGMPGRVLTWEKKPNEKEYTAQEPQEFRFPGIPLFTFYTNRTGRLTAKPFFWKIAELNIHHWQTSSVHTSYVDVIQVALWTRTGVSAGEESDLTIAHSRTVDLPDEQEISTVEHKGSAYEAGKDYKEGWEKRMRSLSMLPFIEQRPGDVTATGDIIRDAKSNAQIHFMIRALENMLGQVWQASATWLNVNRPTSATEPIVLSDDFRIDVFSNFALGVFSAQETAALRGDFDRQVITHETYLAERKKRGGYSETMDPAEEARAARAEQLSRVSDMAGFETGGAEDEREAA